MTNHEDNRLVEDKHFPETLPVIDHSHHPGIIAYSVLSIFLIMAIVGMLFLWDQAKNERVAQCERENILRSKLYGIVVYSEVNVPQEVYTQKVKIQFDKVYKDLGLINCRKLSIKVVKTHLPIRPNRFTT